MHNFNKYRSTKWHYIHERFRTPFYTYLLWDACSNRYNKSIPFNYSELEFIYLDKQIAIDQKGWDKLNKIVGKSLKKDPRILLKLLNDSYKINTKVENWAKKIEKLNFNKVSKTQLLDIWKIYIESLNQFGGYVLLPLAIESDMEVALKKAIKKVYKAEIQNHVFQVLTTPIKYGATQLEEKNLAKLAIKFLNDSLAEKDINFHLREFSWIKNNSFENKFYSKAELIKRIKLLTRKNPKAKLLEINSHNKVHLQEFKKYFNNLAKDKQIKVLIETLQESIYHRSWRTERYYRNAYFLQSFFKHTAKFLELSNFNDLFYLITPEIVSGLENSPKISKKLISERKKGYLILAQPNKTFICSGQHLTEAKKKIDVRPIKLTKKIQGMCAYPGKVKGKVLVIKSKKDLIKITANTILVTPSTTVDFVPYLKKVVAIVTNEGGVLSHASVISRELRIPCVIGTKIATEVLKTGNMVNIDAKHGFVELI